MCNRYSQSKRKARLSTQRFGETEFELTPRYNVAPTQNAPVVLLENGKPVCKQMRWGWTTKFGSPLTNAQAETAQKKLFRNAWAERRCIIPADGFYEWKQGKPAQPYRVVRATRNLFWFAGLWENNEFTILTGPASGFLRSIHNRTPIILCESEIDWWLFEWPDKIRGGWDVISRGVSIVTLEAYPVSPRMTDPRFESPECIDPIVAAQPDLIQVGVDDPKYRWRDLSTPPPEGERVRLLINDEKTVEAEWREDRWHCSEMRNVEPLKWRPAESALNINYG